MADDRHEAYRAMYSTQEIQKELESLSKEQVASLMYDCIRVSLDTSIFETSPITIFKKLLKNYKK